MTKLRLDPAGSVPLYRQIAREIRRLVAIGALRPGEQIPTVRELAVTARVNRNTAARAIQQLEAEGLVRTRVGQGTFVADGALQAGRREGAKAVDAAIDRVLGEAQDAGMPLEDVPPRVVARIESWGEASESGGERGEA